MRIVVDDMSDDDTRVARLVMEGDGGGSRESKGANLQFLQ